jgi:hypothetical protein
VSHHPPVCAVHVKGQNYRIKTSYASTTSLSGTGTMRITSSYKTYFTIGENDVYELTSPVLTLNNLIIGTTYLDICETMTVKSLSRPEQKCEVKFEPRGFWGEICKLTGKTYNGKKETHKIHGNWNAQLSLDKEIVWTRTPYPEKVDWMYGMSKFAIQANYFPKRL